MAKRNVLFAVATTILLGGCAVVSSTAELAGTIAKAPIDLTVAVLGGQSQAQKLRDEQQKQQEEFESQRLASQQIHNRQMQSAQYRQSQLEIQLSQKNSALNAAINDAAASQGRIDILNAELASSRISAFESAQIAQELRNEQIAYNGAINRIRRLEPCLEIDVDSSGSLVRRTPGCQ